METEIFIAADDPVRLVSAVVERMDIQKIERSYSQDGRNEYPPRILLKVMIYAYMRMIYSSREIERACRENICFMYLLEDKPAPDHNTIARFRSQHLQECEKELLEQFVAMLVKWGFVSLATVFIDGTKIEANANRYSFVWRKSTEKKLAKLKEQIKKELPVLKQSLALKWHIPEVPQIHHLKKLRKRLYAKAEAENLDWITGKGHRKKPLQKAIETVNAWLEKWKKYTQDLHICGDRNSYSKTDHADGKRVALYGRTREELYDKVEEAKRQIEECSFRRETPTVKEYCEKWLLMQSAHVRATTLLDYTSKVKNYIIKPLGHMYMADVTPDDVKLAVLPAAKKSESVYRSVNMLMKCIFYSAEDSHIIDENPTKKLSAKGGVPQKTKEALTDEQVDLLLDSIKGLPPYVFVMLGLYAGLRREEILALKWDCVFLDVEAPYLSVRRAWHTEHNRPVILTELKTKAASRDVPLPKCLVECLKEAKEKSTSEYVVANSEGEPLSYTQFKRVWQYIVTRSTKERTYVRYVNGEKIKHTISPVLGEVAPHNGKVTYSMDFQVTPHQLRHTYITNLIYAQVDPKTVQYLAGHENSKITMDIYAKVKYNKPKELAAVVNGAFGQ